MKMLLSRAKKLFIMTTMVLALFMTAPKPAVACDGPLSGFEAAIQFVKDVIDFIKDWFGDIIDFLVEFLSLDTFTLDLRFFEFDFNTRNFFGYLWQNQMRPALQSMTRQLHTATVDQERMRGSGYDGDQMDDALRVLQQEELASMRRHQPSETNCVSGTLAGGLAAARVIQDAMIVAIEREEAERALNDINSDSKDGPVPDLATKFDLYKRKFCSPEHNAGNAACDAAGPVVDHDILTGRKFMNELTINYKDDDIKTGALALMRNIVTPNVNTPVPPEVMGYPKGPTSILNRRYRESRRDVSRFIVSKIGSVRAPGTKMGPYVNDIVSRVGMRQSDQVLSDDPSFNEVMFVRTKLLLLHPQYFATFMDGPEAVEKEQLSLKAFNLMQDRERFKFVQDARLLLATDAAAKIDRAMGDSDAGTSLQEPMTPGP